MTLDGRDDPELANICCLKVVTLSSSVVRTSTALVTNTFRLIRGNSELLTTLVTPVLTEVTVVNRVTSTLTNPLARPTTSLVTSPVTFSTILTQVETESYKILFRSVLSQKVKFDRISNIFGN